MLSYLYWDPRPEAFIIPGTGIPILWYGVLFAFGFWVGFWICVDVLHRFLGGERKAAIQITDRLTVYMIVATIVGARIGHFLFYEKPSVYLKDPLLVIQVWKGGLASHGAAIGIVIALILFARKMKKVEPRLTLIRLLDFVAIPTAFVGVCIRVGNFFNQEILGTVTNVPWAVIFGHPADWSSPAPRHPAQLYEAFFYLCVFFLLRHLSFKHLREGKLIGLFLILVFGFRFAVEFLKLEQSRLIDGSFLTMGQILSLPAILAGILLYFRPFLHFRNR